MADKRIQDFPTLDEAQDTDFILVGANADTYNMTVGTLKKAAKEAATEETSQAKASADASRAASEASRDASESARTAAESAAKAAASMNIDPDDLGLEQDEETGLVYPTYRGVRSENGIPLAATGGGGGSGGGGLSYTVKVTNELTSRAIIVPEGAAAEIKFNYSSVDEEGYDDGAGVGTITIDGIKAATINVPQGSNTVDIAAYLTAGEHTVKLKVTNSEGSSKSLTYTVTLVSLSMSTTMDTLATYSGDAVFYYTPVGTGDKTVHFVMDGKEIGTELVAGSGKSRSYIIPAQSHGGHIFEAYAELTMDGNTVKSNTITLGMMWVVSGNMAPSIVSPFAVTAAKQGEALSIEYLAYDPASESAAVTLSVINPDGTVYSSQPLSVDRTPQTWTVTDYPVGSVKFRLAIGDVSVDKTVQVADSGIVIEPITDSLVLNFDAQGRSNQEDNPAVWTDGTTTASFKDVSFAGSDGWLTDAEGSAMLRLLPGSEMTLPFKLFATDCRTNGATVEVEMATNNVRDYDSVVMSCLSGGRGFKIASQYAQLNSEQSEISMQFKEEQRVRVSFVVGPKNLKRMIYVFVDGIMCGAIQYPEDDDFSQNPAAGITIGAESSGIDIYRIALYVKGLTRQEILSNYVADRGTLGARIDAHKRNDVLDVSDEIVITKLPATLPYMVISCPELPQTKGNAKPCEITYVDPAEPGRSFTAAGASIDVQGTSSAGYKKKNFLISLLNGLTRTADGSTADAYTLRKDSIPVSVFCLKADVASSDNANNVELVRLYNDTCPYRHPAMQADPRVRYGIEGYPIVVFWQNTATGVTTFWGKYNFNNDKSTPAVFGWGAGYECWEIKNNGNDRVNFKKSDFTDSSWQDDFEAVYPKKTKDVTQLKKMTDWVVSTDRGAVSSEAEKAARLTKFKSEFENYFVKDAMLFYYIFTETFLMVDNRAKNFFPVYDPTIDRWYPFPYDMDTALGINNEGQLVFDYDLEDTDQVGGYDVYNAQGSVLWCNVRDAYKDELTEMYQTLRNTNTTTGETLYSYETVLKRFNDHQDAWPEAVWNEDAFEKYLRPLFDDNDASYLTMLQGNKASQRDWWMFNGFRYRDSKYKAGDANTNYITLRCYALGDITVTPYSHIWARIKYASATVTERGKRNVPTTLVNPNDKVTDGETYIYSADRLADIGDLSHLYVGYADFSAARKLQRLKLGDGASGYENTKLNELYVGNNDLLTELDVQNCSALTMAVDLSACDGLETVKAKGSSATGFTLPVGGHIKTLELPGTIANFTIRNQKLFESVSFEGYGALATVRVENTPNVPIETIINSAGALNRVRLVGVEWQAASAETLAATITKLKGCIGMDAAGNNTDNAVVSGRVSVPSVSEELLEEINDTFPELVVVANGVAMYLVRYLNFDGTVLHKAVVSEGANAVDPVAADTIDAPTREGSEDTGYLYSGWGELPTNINSNVNIIAQYIVTYRVQFFNEGALVNTQWIQSGLDAVEPVAAGYISKPTKASTAQYSYAFNVWDASLTNITAPMDINATYTATVRKYTVYWKNGSTTVETDTNVPYGTVPTFNGSTPTYNGTGDAADYEFGGWSPAVGAITGNTTYTAVWKYTGYTYVPLVEHSISGDYVNDDVTSIGKWAFYECAGLTSVKFKSATTVGERAFQGCSSLITAEFASLTSIANHAFNGCSAFETLILRSNTVCTLGGEDVFGNDWNTSPIYGGTGYIYVPAALVDSYKAAAYWSKYANQIRAIEDYPDDVVSYTWDAALHYIQQGTYATNYKIGDCVPLDLGSEGLINMQIAAFDADDLADGSGKAPITWIAKELLSTKKRINPTREGTSGAYTEGTGPIGGWEKCEMRTYLKDTIKPLIPENVRNSIKEVTKSQYSYDTAGASYTQTTTEDVWLPKSVEVSGITALYAGLFPDNKSRIKRCNGSASSWWLRDANNTSYWKNIGSGGSTGTSGTQTAAGVCLCFCT